MSDFFRQFGRLAASLLLRTGVAIAAAQDDVRATLLSQTDDSLKAANEAREGCGCIVPQRKTDRHDH